MVIYDDKKNYKISYEYQSKCGYSPYLVLIERYDEYLSGGIRAAGNGWHQVPARRVRLITEDLVSADYDYLWRILIRYGFIKKDSPYGPAISLLPNDVDVYPDYTLN